MADLVITAANVIAGANAKKATGIAGEAITQGMPIVLDPSTEKYVKADSNSATAALRKPDGFALNAAAANQPITLQSLGDITIGAALTAGLAYYLSDTAGGICPVGDIGSGEYVCLLGIAKSTTVLDICIKYSGAAN